MIRPFTLICMVSAFGAGLYLYQSKHHAQVLDREIMRTIKQIEATHARTGMLRAEWSLLNEPDRLADLAKAHTSLQTLKPTQFVTLADLATRLPGPVAQHPEKLPIEAEPEEPIAAPVAQAAPPPVAKPRETPVVVAEPKPKVEAKPAAVMAEAKPAVRPAEKPIVEKQIAEKPVVEKQAAEKPVIARAPVPAPVPTPVQVAADFPPPIHTPRPRPPAAIVSTDATAPGTVGAAVLRAMRSQNGAYAQAAPPAPAPAPVRSYVQQPAYVQPAYAQPAYSPPAYAQPAYTQPGYAQPSYAAPTGSMLGGRTALPPPVPFASR